ncbi:MAG: glutamine--fructose-6-phosphate transaminase (isomerizing) [Candidatus Woesearchaeota archaeon]
MCGILGYLGLRNGTPIVHEGLKALAYRGYDSWGIAVHCDNHITIQKGIGDITKTVPVELASNRVIGHTRWATHGGVTETNAHPHTNMDKTICVVHNGIIENYSELKTELQKNGYVFASQTDTEVIPHLIDSHMRQGSTFEQAFQQAIGRLEGSYAVLATHSKEAGMLFARNGSPLVLGLGQNEYFISSDIPSFLPHTKTVVHLEDGDYGSITNEVKIYNKKQPVVRQPATAHWDVEVAKKGAYPHFMIKEINEQPLTIRKALNQPKELITQTALLLQNASTVFLVGCGTSYNVCATATYQFSKAGKQTIPALGSEFSQQIPFIDKKTAVIAVSQSGETADIIDAVKASKEKGAVVIGICNVPSSTLARMVDVVISMNCGPELCVLSTKTCTAQLAILFMLAFALRNKDTSVLTEAADAALHVLKQHQQTMPELAKKIATINSMFTIGRGTMSQIAREAALKIKEVSYIHAEGMPAGELKHGSIALIEQGTPVIVFADDETRALTISNAMEVKARGAFVIGIDSKPSTAYDIHIQIPALDDATAILALLPIQLLSYYLAVERGCDPDKPRNLAKSVTVR